MFIDIHTHNTSKPGFPAIQNLSILEAEKVFSSQDEGFFSIGFHPWHADEFSNESFKMMTNWANDKRLIVIGECGLDKNSTASFEKQLFVFEQQIALSEKVNKPLIIHCVGYFNELFEIKKRWNPIQLWIIHGFRGKPELAKQALKTRCALSFGEHYNTESVKETPIDKLFVETDESSISIDKIYNQLAIIKSCNIEDLDASYRLLHFQIEQNRV